ncbi:MAG: hypothetical protein JW955_19150 [Sedimentisphaerales bacterium]|nr:hypothetical protein [Sedimentisphaerales bacterium]
MPFQVGDRVALRKSGAAPAGSCGQITRDYGDGHYDVEVTQTPPPECKQLDVPVDAIYVQVVPCGCP